MIIYIIIKILLSYFLVIKKKWIKDTKKLNFSIDLFLLSYFFFLIYLNHINIKQTLQIFIWGIIILKIFLIYRIINYILKNFDSFLIWIEKKEKIKNILLKPIINKGIYYIIWSLPWNIGYWIYFWVIENGWYFRVWISSNRDIFFWKYFKWDSRDFFFYFFEKIFFYLKFNWIKENFFDNFCNFLYRLLIIFYIIRKRIIEIKIKEYIWIRMIIYMYLSIFYLYFIFYFHILNYYLFWFFIFMELLLLLFIGKIIEYIKEKYKIEIIKLFEEKIITEEFIIIMELLKEPLYIDIRMKWEMNIYIWDKTLSNSVTLNILYKYMIWVNERTEGYYDRIMNIRSRIHRKKYIEERSIIWDVLPRTRYVIYSLKNLGYKNNVYICQGKNLGDEYNFINLKKNKNFYLSYYEKTYSNTSLLMFFWFLRNNNIYWHNWEMVSLKDFYNELQNKNFWNIKNNIEYELFKDFILFYFTYDKRFFGKDIVIKNNILFGIFFGPEKWYAIEELFSNYYKNLLIINKKDLKISENFVGIKNYKLIFKIMGRIQLYEEEAIVWNKELQEILIKKYKFMEYNLNKLEKNKNLESLTKSYYYKFFFDSDLDFGSSNEQKDKRIQLYVEFLELNIKTKISLKEILICFHFKGNPKYLIPRNINKEKYDEIISTDLINWTIWDFYSPEGKELILGLYIRTLISFDNYNRIIYGENYFINDIEFDEKYNLYKYF